MFGTGNSHKIATYGAWKSPITSDLIVAGSIRLSEIAIDGDAIYWLEGWPSENGRNALVKWTPPGGRQEMTSAGFNVRTRVHEYGGGPFCVQDETITFSNFVDQRLYIQHPYSEPQALTAPGNLRFADIFVDSRRGRLFAVREDHAAHGEAVNTIVSLTQQPGQRRETVLVAGADFYAPPA